MDCFEPERHLSLIGLKVQPAFFSEIKLLGYVTQGAEL